jgi:hypothetical protein
MEALDLITDLTWFPGKIDDVALIRACSYLNWDTACAIFPIGLAEELNYYW